METIEKDSVAIRFYCAERWCYVHKLKPIAKFIYHTMQMLLGCTIPYTADLEKGVQIAHFHGIVIHSNTRIGKGTKIYQNVTIGGRNGAGGGTIGEDCVIGAGACILGEIKIGNRVMIGANAVVLEDVPDGCTVVGVPARIVKRDNNLY